MARSGNTRTLSPDHARRVYDRIGSLQDSQAFYEDRATDLLVQFGDFARARRVFEFGCGTGRFAARLLQQELPSDAVYHGVDLSPTMVRLAEERIAGQVVVCGFVWVAADTLGSTPPFAYRAKCSLLTLAERLQLTTSHTSSTLYYRTMEVNHEHSYFRPTA